MVGAFFIKKCSNFLFICFIFSRFFDGKKPRGRIPETMTFTWLNLRFNVKATQIKPSTISWGQSVSRLLVPQHTKINLIDCGNLSFSARHRVCCILSPPIPQFIVLYPAKCLSQTVLYLESPATMESPISRSVGSFFVSKTLCWQCVWYHPLLWNRLCGVVVLDLLSIILIPICYNKKKPIQNEVILW